MAWQIEFDPAARKDLAALDRPVQSRIRDFLVQRLAPAEDPHKLGAAMTGPWKGFWKYRVGDLAHDLPPARSHGYRVSG